MTAEEMDLTDAELGLLRAGVSEWGGPTSCSDELALAMGFAGRDGLYDERQRLLAGLAGSEPLELFDWARILVLTEFAFASNVFGSGLDWSITTGIADAEAVELLRSVQRKLGRGGAGRGQFGPTVHQEFRWQAGAATAIRLYKGKRSDLGELRAALDSTLDSFGGDLADLADFQSSLAEIAGMDEADQYPAVMEKLDHLAEMFATRPGNPNRRMFWL
jgi:hypothetical protein